MKLTAEQKAIINSTGNIKINAVAGSGKTTTLIEYAKARPKGSKILYLAFNKSVKLEAIKKFREQGLYNVKVETAHSLAYKHIVAGSRYKINSKGYQTHEIAEVLGLQGNGEKHTEYIVANHINKFIAYFCNSNKAKVQDLDYRDLITDKKALSFVNTFYRVIERQTRVFLSRMNSGAIDITHDFYLKKFQLSNPQLLYNFILFDEGQDASPAMLDVFFKQKATKVIVGDTHQQIYGWRFAVNSLEKTEFKEHLLSTSFRFTQDIADLALGVLKWKDILSQSNTINIIGNGKSKLKKVKAVLARTNLGLLLKAIEFVTENTKKRVYFEGNINSYTYASDGASLYDVLNLYNGKKHLIRDKLIRSMGSLDDLEDYIEKTEDAQLSMMVEIVREYGNEIPGLIKNLKEQHLENDDKEKADMIFSTVHRSKGMEYDVVHLVNDFITENKLEKVMEDLKSTNLDLSRLNEEINLLYVAITRTKNQLTIPETLLPKQFNPSKQIQVEEVETEEEIDLEKELEVLFKKSDYEVRKESIKKKHKAAYQPWTPQLEEELTQLFCEGKSIKEMADHFQRTRGAIISRIKKLELRELYP